MQILEFILFFMLFFFAWYKYCIKFLQQNDTNSKIYYLITTLETKIFFFFFA